MEKDEKLTFHLMNVGAYVRYLEEYTLDIGLNIKLGREVWDGKIHLGVLSVSVVV